MRMAREILRLYFGLHLKKRQIGRACGVAPRTEVDYIRRAEGAGISWPLPNDLDDTALEAKLNERKESPRPARRPLPGMEEIHVELRKKGVTLQLLWMEYKERFPEGYQHSQFCEYYISGITLFNRKQINQGMQENKNVNMKDLALILLPLIHGDMWVSTQKSAKELCQLSRADPSSLVSSPIQTVSWAITREKLGVLMRR
jgi:hypothetical protein